MRAFAPRRTRPGSPLRSPNLSRNLPICRAHSTPDDLFGDAPAIAKAIGATNAVAFDLTAACSGFLFATVTASQFLHNGAAPARTLNPEPSPLARTPTPQPRPLPQPQPPAPTPTPTPDPDPTP